MPKTNRWWLLLLVGFRRLWRHILVASSLVMTLDGFLPLLDSNATIRAPVAAVMGCSVILGVTLLMLELWPGPAFASRRLLRPAMIGVTCVLVATSVILELEASAAQPPQLFEPTTVLRNERAIEQQVNNIYCNAKGYQICEFGTIADAKQLFPLREWPVGSKTQDAKRVSAACYGFVESLSHWGYQARMGVCRVCGIIRARQQSIQRRVRANDYEKLLQVVPKLSLGEPDWCGRYLVNSSTAVDANQAPYRRHLEAFQELVTSSKSVPSRFEAGIRSLQVLIVACVLTQVAIAKCEVGSLAVLMRFQSQHVGKTEANFCLQLPK